MPEERPDAPPRRVVSQADYVAPAEPHRNRPAPALSAKMSRLRRRDNETEIRLRRALHALGLRFRTQVKVPGNRRRTIDIAFTRARLAVFVDGCFWHACPDHGTAPRTNSEWWRWKLQRNVDRDRDTDHLLGQAGWQVIRIWEHENPSQAAAQIANGYRARMTR